MRHTLNYIILTSFLIFIVSCNIYSFNGASIPVGSSTVKITTFTNNTSNSTPDLQQKISEKLKDIFLEQTNLNLVNEYADLNFIGSIEKYEIKPISIKANETTSQNRLSITVKVKYVNNISDQYDYETSFTRYSDFDGLSNLNDIENELTDLITDQLVEDIFNKAVINW
tara:strand:- start:6926 stop:7432 length:507 start_codon:yes stop_codon:yes gene_type:complete